MSKRKVFATDDVTVHYDSEFEEYRVHERGESTDHDYFTSDKQDAIDTAQNMQGRRARRDAGRYRDNAGQAKMPQAFTYADAQEVYANTRRGDLGANTKIRLLNNDVIVVTLHQTDIIAWHPDGIITLNNGGYATNTTVGRMNAFLSPYIQVFRQKGTMYAQTRTGKVFPFRGNIVHIGPDDLERTHSNPRRNPQEPDSVHVGFNKILVVDRVWKSLGLDRHKRFPSTSDLGGYPLYYIVAEPQGKGYKDHASVLASTLNDDKIGGDDVVIGVEVNWEDDDMTDDITGEPIPSAYGERENPKSRQVIFRQTGGAAYGKAQRIAFDLRSAGYEADQGSIPSQAGSWADSIYILTNAPIAAIRKAAKAEGLELSAR